MKIHINKIPDLVSLFIVYKIRKIFQRTLKYSLKKITVNWPINIKSEYSLEKENKKKTPIDENLKIFIRQNLINR